MARKRYICIYEVSKKGCKLIAFCDDLFIPIINRDNILKILIAKCMGSAYITISEIVILDIL